MLLYLYLHIFRTYYISSVNVKTYFIIAYWPLTSILSIK